MDLDFGECVFYRNILAKIITYEFFFISILCKFLEAPFI